MPKLVARRIDTRGGGIAMIAAAEALERRRPIVLMLHGALRTWEVLAPWAERLEAEADIDVVFMDLPGHGRSPPITPASAEVFAENISDALMAAFPGRPLIVIGESLGGLIGIALATLAPAGLRGVLAADPMLTTAKQWQLYTIFQRELQKQPANGFLRSLADEMFGITPGAQAERLYYPLLARGDAPVHILTGDVAQMPPRALPRPACLVDAVDEHVIAACYGPRVQVHRLKDCGHLVLDDRPDAVLEILRPMLSALADGAASP